MVAALQERELGYRDSGRPPVALRQATADFERELKAISAQLRARDRHA